MPNELVESVYLCDPNGFMDVWAKVILDTPAEGSFKNAYKIIAQYMESDGEFSRQEHIQGEEKMLRRWNEMIDDWKEVVGL